MTSTLHTGDLGGLAGADEICQTRAQEADLPGTYRAWLSTDEADGTPAARFTQSQGPYVKVDGTKVADDWADLTFGGLDSPIDTTEIGGAVPEGAVSCLPGSPTVWTGTSPNGILIDAELTCSNWTSASATSGSLWGRTTETDVTWTNWCQGGDCSRTAPIYCFQQ